MKKVSSFTIYKVKCPVCGTLNRFKGIMPKAYVETGRDTDFRPAVADFEDSGQKVRNPLLYFMATCRNCFFTHELNREFIEWENSSEFKSPGFKASKRKHVQELKRKEDLIRRMGKALKPSKDPFGSSAIKFLLGIYDESLKPDSSSYNLARYYLRVAWIFREEKEREKSAWIKENLTVESLDETLKSIQVQHSDYLEKVQRLKGLVEFESSSGYSAGDKKTKSHCSFLMDRMTKELESLKDSLDRLQGIFRDNQNKPSARGSSGVRFDDFLFDLKMDWPGVPVNEKEALELSLENYKKSLTQNLRGSRIIQIPYLIGELSRRIGDLSAAREYFDLTIDAGNDFIQQNKDDQVKTALAQKILQMAHQQKEVILRGREKMA